MMIINKIKKIQVHNNRNNYNNLFKKLINKLNKEYQINKIPSLNIKSFNLINHHP